MEELHWALLGGGAGSASLRGRFTIRGGAGSIWYSLEGGDAK